MREGLMALYLAAIDLRVAAAVSNKGLVSYQDIVDADGTPDFDYYVPGILKHADVPQIIAAIARRRVIVSAPLSITHQAVADSEARKAYAFAIQGYQLLNAGGRFLCGSALDPAAELAREPIEISQEVGK